jgi:hypothetical protein
MSIMSNTNDDKLDALLDALRSVREHSYGQEDVAAEAVHTIMQAHRGSKKRDAAAEKQEWHERGLPDLSDVPGRFLGIYLDNDGHETTQPRTVSETLQDSLSKIEGIPAVTRPLTSASRSLPTPARVTGISM